ncbi:hypothetical protein RRG08_007193 [Elysia crispata]|uniref:Fibrinogen C-terminal domain-containing protein n=1 Tax=Elysia crispata TaxID=231223 RepID=A0AAE1B4P3_9GAST|nr:hypothetical protein RRG08_007193 [Elysia crispata]
MEAHLCVILVLSISCCLGLELNLDRNAGEISCVLTCTENSKTPKTNNGQSDSAVSFNTILSLSLFKRIPGGSRADGNDERETPIASVTTDEPSVTDWGNTMEVSGSLVAEKATIRVEYEKLEDCQSEFTCHVRGLDSQGREAVTVSSLLQQPSHKENQVDVGGMTSTASLQLLASIQQLVTQSVEGLEDKIEKLQRNFNDRSNSFENRIEDKIGQLQSTMGSQLAQQQKEMRDQGDSFERRVENRLNFFENRMEDKIDNNNNLNKLIHMDVKVSRSLAEFREEAKADIGTNLNDLRQEVRRELNDALRNVTNNVKGIVNTTFDLLLSVENDFDIFKSNSQENLITVKREAEKILNELMSRENVSHRLWKESLTLNDDLLESFRELKSKLHKCQAEPRCECENLLSQLESKVSADLKSIKDTILPRRCQKGMAPYMSQYFHYAETNPKNTLNISFLCDSVSDGGGWIVIQRRGTGKTNFDRNWADYKQGFGSFDGEFWLGNDNIHAITSKGTYELRVELIYKGKSGYAHYDKFSIASEWNKYELSIGNYDGTAGDSLRYHTGRAFTTFDRDNDLHDTENCSKKHGGGWWFRSCDQSNLNGKWAVNNDYGVEWYDFTGADSASFTEMKVRRV